MTPVTGWGTAPRAVPVGGQKKGAELALRAFAVYQEENRCYLPTVKSIFVFPATFTSCEVVLPLCHTKALYCPSGTFWMK